VDEELSDTVDDIVSDLRQMRPELEPLGLPITGRVLRLAQFLATRREEVLAEFGLTVADFDVLASFRRRAGAGAAIKVGELQRWMMLSSGGMTKRLDRLETVGLILRGPDPTDRRGVLIQLTLAGVDMIDRALPAVTAFENRLVASAIESPEARRHVEDGLRRLLVAQEAV
jgi:DNA-binding MarR family transcriptional regulator